MPLAATVVFRRGDELLKTAEHSFLKITVLGIFFCIMLNINPINHNAAFFYILSFLVDEGIITINEAAAGL